jgi:hypothetical protein
MTLEIENGQFHIKQDGIYIASGSTPEKAQLAIQALPIVLA